MNCRLCSRGARGDSGLCVFHWMAREALRTEYESWADAYGKLSWKEYLDRIKRREEAGQWVKEVVALEEDEVK